MSNDSSAANSSARGGSVLAASSSVIEIGPIGRRAVVRENRGEGEDYSQKVHGDVLPLLRDLIRGEVLLPADVPAYEASISTVWNANVRKRRPAAIVKVTCTRDVVNVVNFVREHKYDLAVRSAGAHSPYALADDAVVVDTSLMRAVLVDEQAKECVCQPGCLVGDLDYATTQYGLACPAPVVSHTGLVGATLGGGIGFLSRLHGLSIDNVISMEVVLPDGQVVTCSKDINTDLFWGMRGAGMNFGVVTAVRFRLFPIPPLLAAGCLVHNWDCAKECIEFYQSVLENNDKRAPAEAEKFTCHLLLNYGPDGRPKCIYCPAYFGSVETGMKRINEMKKTDLPVVLDTVKPMAYDVLQSSNDDIAPPTCAWYECGPMITDLTSEVIDILIHHFESLPADCSQLSTVFIQQMGGAIRRANGDDDTAFYGRMDSLFWVGIVGAIPSPVAMTPAEYDRRFARLKQWVNGFKEALKPYTVSHYVNAAEEPHVVHESLQFHWSRLQSLKGRYDPDNMFHNCHNVPPDALVQSSTGEEDDTETEEKNKRRGEEMEEDDGDGDSPMANGTPKATE